MRHNFSKHIVFHKNPVSFDKNSERELLQYCLGATLYMPSTRQIADKIIKNSIPELTSMVMCFEDAISLNDLPFGEANVIEELDNLDRAVKNKELS
ncbi:MAG: HpcH/HpaI aldolase/citrate lyase family protein, partial [Gammaproteobacteria bacterium]